MIPLFARPWFAHHHVTFSNAVVAFTVYFCIAYACGALMASKKRNYVVGFLLAFFVPVVGAICVLCIPPAGRVRASRYARVRAPREYSPGADARAKFSQSEAAASAPDLPTCSFCGLKLPANADLCRVCQTPQRPYGNGTEAAA